MIDGVASKPLAQKLLLKANVKSVRDHHSTFFRTRHWTKRTGVTVSTTNVRFAWAMTIIFENKNLDKAKKFAKWGLSNLTISDNEWFGKVDFERVLAH